jgi:hypothetical protein
MLFWQPCCGFLDLSIDESMAIQEELLMEQLQLLAASELGRAIVGGKLPLVPDEFRQVASITTYKGSASCFTDQREEALPVIPICWMQASGRIGESIAANGCQSHPNSMVKWGNLL